MIRREGKSECGYLWSTIVCGIVPWASGTILLSRRRRQIEIIRK